MDKFLTPLYVEPMNKSHSSIRLLPGREKLLLSGHPWIFSGALENPNSGPKTGCILAIENSKGITLGYGLYNPQSKIRLRVLSFDPMLYPDENWLKERLKKACQIRESLVGAVDAYRLVHSDGDQLSGLVIDRLGDYLILQSECAGMDSLKDSIAKICAELLSDIKGIWEKSDSDGRALEGLKPIHQCLWGEPPPQSWTIKEGNLALQVHLESQKTGYYSDQRDNRLFLKSWARGRRVLDGFCYSGGFGLQCMEGGAKEVLFMDQSSQALAQVEENITLNDLHTPYEKREQDVFQGLRDLEKEKRLFDLVILDPPKLVPHRRALEKGLRAYKDLILHGAKLLSSQGLLAIFSCSGLVSSQDLLRCGAFAAKDLGRDFKLVKTLTQSSCHLVSTRVPEGAYLTGHVFWVGDSYSGTTSF